LTASTDFARAYARYFPPLQAKCRRLLGRSAAAEDVAQETFARLWSSQLRGSQDARAVTAWLYRTCTRLAIDVLRDRRKTEGEDDGLEGVPCSVDVAASAEARGAIRALARAVPEEELAVAVLCRVDGLPQPEAAAVLGVAERTVRRMLARFDERTASLRKEFSP
jgi:RNA polymerase sigma-70 factor (ECF subfamily)